MSVQRELLEPFADAVVKTKPGGKGGRYVSWSDKIQRLYHLGIDFDWEIVSVTTAFDPATANAKLVDVNEPVAVQGRLTARFVDGVGGLRVRTVDGVGQGSDAKKASTDAFSRACAMLGLGLHLWCQGGDKDGGYWITTVLDRDEPQGTLDLEPDEPKVYSEDDPERTFE